MREKIKIKKSASKLPTSGRIGRITKIMISKTGVSVTRKVMGGAEIFKKLDYPSRADYVRETVQRMKRILGTAETKDIFVSCGMMCCGTNSRKLAKQLMQKSKSLKDFISKLNEKHLGGGRLKLKDENTIIGGYDRCYCGMVSKTRKKFPDLTYCQCGVGWYKQLFETALGRPVQVKILQSIISGARTCEFVIKISSNKIKKV